MSHYLDKYMEDFYIQVVEKNPNNLGGFETRFTDGEKIKAAINTKKQTEVDVASKDGQKTIYNVLVRPDVHLRQNDVIRRVNTGSYFRITQNTDDNTNPSVAHEKYAEVKAEVVTA